MEIFMTTASFMRLAAAVGTSIFLFSALPANASMDTWIKGASITPSNPTSFQTDTFFQSLADLKATNANSVSLVIPVYQDNLQSMSIHAGGNTPTDASLVAAIQKAHSLGLAVALKPHLDPLSGQWRADIDPTDRAAWFGAYDAMVLHYAQLAQANHVELIVIGTELIDMSTDDHNTGNTAAWRMLISDVRAVYGGKLTYAANWGTGLADEKDHIAFWDALDYAGVDAYYPLGTNGNDTSVQSFMNAWAQWDKTDFAPFAAKVGKPVLFTEVGYKSTNGSHVNPEDYSINNGYNATEQTNAYTALFSYWSQNPTIAGMSIWQWDPAANGGGVGDQDYTPQHKPGQAVLSAWYGGTGVAYVAPKVNIAAATQTQQASTNQSITVTANVTNTGGSVSNGLIDIEVYDHAGTKLFQQFAQNQTFGSSPASYSTSWTPTSPGTYSVKTGAFSNDWSTNYSWNDAAETITVGALAPAAPASFAVTATPVSYSALHQPITIPVQVKDAGGAATALVDVEVYASNGQKVFQDFYDNQSFAANETKNFAENWTPDFADTYHVSVGVFAPNWTSNYVWVGNVENVAYATPSAVVPIVPAPTPTPVVVPPVASSTPISPVTPTVASTTPPVAPVATSTPVVPTLQPVVATTTPTLPHVVATSTPTTPPVVATTTPIVPTVPPIATSTPTVPVVPPAVTATIDVWWPSAGAPVAGTQPFKAIVRNQSVDTYEMYWQVDGDVLHHMYSTPDGYPHKEDWVNVGDWNWHGAGPYQVTFIAKDSSGAVIATNTVPVVVQH